MRLPNNYGSVRKLSGKRRRPYQVLITTGYTDDLKQIQTTLGYYPTREEALTFLSDYNKSPYDLTKDYTFEQVYNALDLSRKSKYSIRSLATAYNRCGKLHRMKIREIKKSHLQQVAGSLSSYSKATQQEVKNLWTLMFNYAMENDIIQKDYSKFVTFYSDATPRAKLPFEESDVKKFNDDLLILCLTGLRISEYLRMKTSDIKDGCFYVKGTKTESADRIVPVHNKIADIVDLRANQVYLCEWSGKPMLYDLFLRKVFQPEMERIGIHGHTIHDTRRTFASIASRSKMDKAITKRLLGHKLNDITEDVYTHKNIDDLKREMDKFTL